MLGGALVRPLEEEWQGIVDGVARARGWPGSGDPARLGALVAELSEAYNQAGVAGKDALAARLGFSFARDVPKAAGAVRELIAAGGLAMPADRPLRVLDLGAGLGATTWGVAGALEAAGARGTIEATWVDDDPDALDVGQSLLRAAGPRAVAVEAHAVRDRSAAGSSGPYDLVLLGQVLSEMDRALEPAARVARHAALLLELARGALGRGGSLVVVEPALRDRSRHLHAVRDAVLAAPQAPTLFAPCLHAAACPALLAAGDWCHEDLPVDLPGWLVPVARAAGLRWQGLTFSYLVLRTDGLTLRGASGASLRVVSAAIVTKGKREAFLCGASGTGAARVCVRRLDRDAAPDNAAWDDVCRGELLVIDPPPAGGRIAKEAKVARLTD
jgi:hypothetical protein